MKNVPIRPEQTNLHIFKTQFQNLKPQKRAGRETLLLIIRIIKTQRVVIQTKMCPFHKVKNMIQVVEK